MSRAWLWLFLFLGWIAEARADVLVLTHGYFSGEEAWSRSGVVGELESAGWLSGGVVAATPGGIRLPTEGWTGAAGGRRFFLADLPSEAPLELQSAQLHEVVRAIRGRRGAEEKLVLIGHSAGGVVARLLMVRESALNVFGLITIAAPHLGTDKAEVAGLLASTPLSMVAPMMGAGTLNRSRQLYEELARERPGSFLHQLNRQPHPKARYVSLVRREAFALFGDNTVPVWSQDLSGVVALREVATSVSVGVDHALAREDGRELVRILREWAL